MALVSGTLSVDTYTHRASDISLIQNKTMFDVDGPLTTGSRLVFKSVQTEMLLADQQWPLSNIINQLYSDWAQLMQITGPGNKHYSGEKGLYPDQ